MRESLFKLLSSVRLVQEISSSTSAQYAPLPSPVQEGTEFPSDLPLPLQEEPKQNSLAASESTADNTRAVPPSIPTAVAQAPLGNPVYWPAQAVQPAQQPMPNYTPATQVLPFWQTWAQFPGPAREWRNLCLGTPANPATLSGTSVRSHSRKNSRHSIRHHRAKLPSLSKPLYTSATHRTSSKYQYVTSPKNTEAGLRPTSVADKGTPKALKLLCLWPLPVITHHVIVMALIVSTLNYLNVLHVSCSSPSFVIHRLEVVNLFLSPFLFDWTLHSVLLYSWNILILGLFEESLTHMLGGTRRFVRVLLGVVVSVCTIRQGLGYLFSKSTGWAVPSLFFSDSVHECNQGLAPFLFALLTIQSLRIDDKYILIFGKEGSSHTLTVHKVTLQLVMCLLNYAVKNILWWSLTGVLTGYLATIVIQMSLAREKHGFDSGCKDTPTTPLESSRRMVPLWRLLWAAVRKGAAVVTVTLFVLLICNNYYARDGPVDPAVLNQLTHDHYFFTFVMMTAPRRGDPPLLSKTLHSYLANWPVDPAPGSLYSRTQMIVYTHFTHHPQFDEARKQLSNDLRGQRYIKWVREEGDKTDQRLHVSKALSLAADNFQSSYVALLEDDFPVCGKEAWHEIQNVVYEANQHRPDHCGVFVGTGGSGLFIKPNVAKLIAKLLLEYKDTPPDIVIQKCLRGDLAECSQCSQTLVTSKTLLMHHIGYNSSTSVNRVYKKGEFQCGWRHPFNGDPNVITL